MKTERDTRKKQIPQKQVTPSAPPQTVRKPTFFQHFGHKKCQAFQTFLSVNSYLTLKTE